MKFIVGIFLLCAPSALFAQSGVVFGVSSGTVIGGLTAHDLTAERFFGNGAGVTGVAAASISPGAVDLSTVTLALSGKLSSTVTVPVGLVDLSTVTAALGGFIPSTATGSYPLTAEYATKSVQGTQSCTGNNFFNGLSQGFMVSCNQPGDVTGNAATVTNGVYTNGSYGNPNWIKSLATGKIDLSTVTAAIGGRLSSTVTVPVGIVDLSTVSAAFALTAQLASTQSFTGLNSFTTNFYIPNGVLYVGTTSKPVDETYYTSWFQGGMGIISTQPAGSQTPVLAVHNTAGDDTFFITEAGVLNVLTMAPVNHHLGMFIGDKNDWLNVGVQNKNSGIFASSDLQAFADDGTEDSGYIDMGIQSSGFNDPTWSFAGPNDGYLFVAGPLSGPTHPSLPGHGDLAIGTRSTGTVVNFFVGGTKATDLKVVISSAGIQFVSTNTYVTLGDNYLIRDSKDLIPTSTITYITSYSTTATSGGRCIPGSTVTFTTNGNSFLDLRLSGSITNTNNQTAEFTFLVDGAYQSLSSASVGIVSQYITANRSEVVSVHHATDIISKATHTACAMAWSSGNTLSIPANHRLQFAVFERYAR